MKRYSPFKRLASLPWRKGPLQLTLFLTRRCNGACPFCFYLARPPETGGELSLGEIKKISAKIGDLLWLAFSGGEIFLRSDLPAIVNTFYGNNRPAIILLPTNGLMPELIRQRTETILRQCPRSTVVVKLSLDGPREIHDLLRGRTGAYERVMACARGLLPLLSRHDNFELGINTVFCAANQERMRETIDLVEGISPALTHTISMVRGDIAEPGLKEIDLEKYRAATLLLAERQRKTAARYRFRGGGLKAAQDLLQRRLIHRTAKEGRRLVPCRAGHLTAVITESGRVFPCESFSQSLGSLRETDYDLNKILAAAGADAVRAEIEQKRCHCTHECYMLMNILFNPRQYPTLFREYLRERALARSAARPGAAAEDPGREPDPEKALKPDHGGPQIVQIAQGQ